MLKTSLFLQPKGTPMTFHRIFLAVLLVMHGSCIYAFEDYFDDINQQDRSEVFSDGVATFQKMWDTQNFVEGFKQSVSTLVTTIKEKQQEWQQPYQRSLSTKKSENVSVDVEQPEVLGQQNISVVQNVPTVQRPAETTTTKPLYFSRNTIILSTLGVATVSTIVYVLHKKGLLKKYKQEIEKHPYCFATIVAGLVGLGAGGYFYF